MLAGMRTTTTFQRQVSKRGKLDTLNLGCQYNLATPDPPDYGYLFTIHRHQTEHA